MRNKILILSTAAFLAPLFCSHPVLSSDINPKAGTTGFGFLKIGAGARATSMGSAFAGVTNDIHCSYWNPAGLGWIEEQQVTATYLNYLLDIQSGYAGYARPYKHIGVFGITIQYMNFGDFDKTVINESTGQLEYQGTFGASDMAIGLSYGRMLVENMSLGATLYPFIRESIEDYSSTAMAVNLGVQYYVPAEGGLTLGAALQHAGTTLSGFTADHKDDLPLNIRLGAGLKLAHLPVLLAFDVNKATDQDIRFNLGGEVTPDDMVRIRLGYRFNSSDLRVGTGKDDIVGIAGGFGFTLQSYTIDYALSSFGELGFVHRVTFSTAL